MLENNISKNESICKWIKPGEQIEINGFIIKRGFFYVGDYFEIPRSFKNNIIEYNDQQYNTAIDIINMPYLLYFKLIDIISNRHF